MTKPLGAIALAVCPAQQRYPEPLVRLGRIPTSASSWRCDPSRCTRGPFLSGQTASDWTTGPCNACLRICKHTSRLTFLSTN